MYRYKAALTTAAVLDQGSSSRNAAGMYEYYSRLLLL